MFNLFFLGLKDGDVGASGRLRLNEFTAVVEIGSIRLVCAGDIRSLNLLPLPLRLLLKLPCLFRPLTRDETLTEDWPKSTSSSVILSVVATDGFGFLVLNLDLLNLKPLLLELCFFGG